MTTQTLWIIVVVVAVVVLIALVAGLTVSRRRRISLRERDELETPAAEERPRQGNTYQATGGFDFSAGSGAATGTPTLPPRPEPGPDLLAPPREKEPEPRRRGGAAAAGGAALAGGAAASAASAAPAPEKAPERAPEKAPEKAPGRETPTDGATAAPTAPDEAQQEAPETAPPARERPAGDELTGTADDVRTPPRGLPTGGTATEARTPPDGIPAVRPAETATPPEGIPAASATAAPAAPAPETAPDTAPSTAAPEAPGTASPEAPAAGIPTTEAPAAPEAPPAAAAAAGTAASVAPTAPPAERVPEAPPVERAPEVPPVERAPEVPPVERAPEVPPVERVPGAPSVEPAAPPAQPTAPPAETAPAAPPAPTEEIAPAEGRLERLRGNLSRSRSAFGQSLLGLLGGGELDEESWEDVEATLLQADLGPEMTAELVETLRTELARRAVRTPDQARQLLREVLIEALESDLNRSIRALPHDGRPGVLLVVGVNGTGKTTTTGKLARVLVASGRHVVLGAADTFRAAAAEQLTTWGERAGAAVVRGPEGADPAAVAFDAVKRGTADGADAVILDTAGRLHTKTGLMDELGKVKRVVERQAEVDEVILVLDATTGQNGLIQARVFGEVVKVTGIALTKLDGTAKGGIVFRVQRELGVPVKLVGLGEGPDDLAPFEPKAFVDALLG